MPAVHVPAGAPPAARLTRMLARAGLDAWAELAAARWAAPGHGDFARWRAALARLPAARAARVELDRDRPVIGAAAELDAAARAALAAALRELIPWRKGPFELFGLALDAEWRSELKWRRVRPHLSDLAGRRVLDAGCGNGYSLLRMLGAGARPAVGAEPSWLPNLQFAALCAFLEPALPAGIVPARLEELPGAARFDTVFSMGVLPHQRRPEEHLRELRRRLRPGGELALETLVAEPAPPSGVLELPGRYAGMRNVWRLPSPARALDWLKAAGFAAPRCVDRTATQPAEQRRTEWMPGPSLADRLDPADPSRTVEGHPAPLRAVFVARG